MKTIRYGLFALCVLCNFLTIKAQENNHSDIRFMTFNIHHGADIDGDLDLERVGNVISEYEPDILALQEVDRKTKRVGGRDLSIELGCETGMTALFGKAINYAGGQYGLAVLTKYLVIKSEVHKLPHVPSAEQRVAMEVVLELPSGDTIRVINAHLSHKSDSLRTAQFEYVKQLVNDGVPTLLAGDFNAYPEEVNATMPEWTMADQHHRFTFPSIDPEAKIDYILSWPEEQWQVKQTLVIGRPEASDHLPLTAVLQLKK